VREIEQMQRNGAAIQRDPVGEDVLRRVADGLLVSARAPQKVADFYKTVK
jgi:hypothetical protein